MKNVEHNNWSGKCGNGAKRHRGPKNLESGNRGPKNLESGNRSPKNLESGIWLPLIHPPHGDWLGGTRLLPMFILALGLSA